MIKTNSVRIEQFANTSENKICFRKDIFAKLLS